MSPFPALFSSTSDHSPLRTAALLAAALALPAAILPAQWTSNAKKNTFVDANCPPPPGMAQILALDPVLVPCNNGCFYAWVDPNGAIQIQVIDDCGYRALSSPHVVADTGTHPFAGGIFGMPSQLAGCQYLAKNELFLAYTVWNGTGEEMRGDVFTYASGVLTATGAVPLLVSVHPQGILTPVADSSFSTFGNRDGAVWGCRDFDIFFGTTNMNIGNVKTAGLAMTTAVADTFVVPNINLTPRLSVLSDNAGGTYAAWRGWDAINNRWYHQGTRANALSTPWSPGWPTLEYMTTRTTDDWVLAADRLSGVFFAQTVGLPGTTLWAGHNDGTGEPGGWSFGLTAATVNALESVHALAMVGISPAGNGDQRAALAYRAHTGVELVELCDNGIVVYLGTSGTNPANLATVSGIASVRGCAVQAHRGIAVGWTAHTGNGAPFRLYGQEVETAAWTKLWNSGNATIVSDNDPFNGERKFVPMVVRKHTLPEVIFGWIDQRPTATGPGAYVQSVADDYLVLGMGLGFKKKNGVLGSSAWCFQPVEHFGIHDFVVTTGDPTDPHDPFGDLGSELFAFDKNDGSYDLLKDINPGPVGSNPGATVQLGARRLFAASDAATGREPWVTDGTSAGTQRLGDCAPGASSSSPQFLAAIGSVMLFSATTSATGRELWRTDGTPAGTALVRDLLPGIGNGVVSGTNAVIGGYLYFWGNNGTSGIELWRTDGTAAGTTLVVDLSPGSANTGAQEVAVLDHRLMFGALVAGTGNEPWVLDTTTGLASLLLDIAVGSSSSGPAGMTRAGNAIYFSAAGSGGRELWRTDGTSAGTQMVADIHPTASSTPGNFTPGNGFVLFTANDGSHGEELWRTDGTAGGTTMVVDFHVGSSSSNPRSITPLGSGRWVFAASSSATDREPWVTDGTIGGTAQLADINPGPMGSDPENFDVVAGTLYFAAYNSAELVTMQCELAGAPSLGQGCPGTGGLVPTIGSGGGAASLGNATFTVTLSNAAPSTFAALIFSASSMAMPIGGCTLYVGLPELGMFLAPTDSSGNGSVSLPVPNDPGLVGATFYFQWAVVDAAGGLLGAFALSDALQVTVEG